MVGAGVPRLVVPKILNHVETGVTAVYDRHSYDLEKRAALDFWGKRLEEIVSGKCGRECRGPGVEDHKIEGFFQWTYFATSVL